MKSFRTFVESKETSFKDEALEFVRFACEWLEIGVTPEIFLIDDKQAAVAQRSFGGYSPAERNIRVNIAERHKVDIFRTLAHELVHYKQDLNDMLDENSGDTGSDEENEANSIAGIILREYARTSNGKIFEGYEELEGELLNEGFFKKKPKKNDWWTEDEKDQAEYLAKRHNGKVVVAGNTKDGWGYAIKHPTSPGLKTKKHFDNSNDFKYDLK